MIDRLHSGTIEAVGGIAISFTILGSLVRGSVQQTGDGDPVELTFSRPVTGPEFDLPLNGTITDRYKAWPTDGQTAGTVCDAGASRSWDVRSGTDRRGRAWQAML